MQIPRAVQHEIIRTLMTGQVPDGYTLEQISESFKRFDPTWYALLSHLLRAMDLDLGVERQAYLAAADSLLDDAKRETLRMGQDFRAEIQSLATLAVPEIEWLWKHWIPLGMLTIMGSLPSAGKSYVSLDLAARIIAGTVFPDGMPVIQRGPVLYVDGENVPQIHQQRARAWGMDRSQLYLMGPDRERMAIDLDDDCDQERLATWAKVIKPKLIIVDSLSTISLKGDGAVEEVREILTFLNWVARDNNCGMLIDHHLRKPGAQLPLPRFLTFSDLRGSGHIAAMGRSIIGLHWIQTGPKMDLNNPRIMEVLKTNLCQYPKPIGVTFAPMAADPEVAELQYGEPAEAYREPTKRMDCAEWLVALLREEGPMKPAEVRQLAEEEGYSKGTVQRARNELGDQIVNTSRSSHDARNMWALAVEGDEDADGEESDEEN